MIDAICNVCGRSFAARRYDAKTCGATCRKRLSRQQPGHREPTSSGWKAHWSRLSRRKRDAAAASSSRDAAGGVTPRRRSVTRSSASQVPAGKRDAAIRGSKREGSR